MNDNIWIRTQDGTKLINLTNGIKIELIDGLKYDNSSSYYLIKDGIKIGFYTELKSAFEALDFIQNELSFTDKIIQIR